MNTSHTVLVPRIENRIQVIRGLRVLLDVDLAALYGVQTKRLNEQVKRNRERFPGDFLFQLAADEKAEVVANCDHLQNLKFSKALPFAFTEHGAIQAANVLASSQAVEMGIYVVRAFVQLRQLLNAREWLARCDQYARTLAQRKLSVATRISPADFDRTSNKIKVMTMKVNKGLEFPVVALPDVGNMPAAGEDEKEAARVFYVAATRATNRLVIGVTGRGKYG